MIIVCLDGEDSVTFSIAEGRILMSAKQENDTIEEFEFNAEDVNFLAKIFDAITTEGELLK